MNRPVHKTGKTFRSRISVLIIIFFLAILTPIILLVGIEEVNYPGFYILGAIPIFIALIFTGSRYTISDDKIFIRLWFIPNGSVNIADIRLVSRSYDPLSSPASSLKRLRIDYRKGAKNSHILISPTREQKFIDELRAINPEIEISVLEKVATWLRPQDWDI